MIKIEEINKAEQIAQILHMGDLYFENAFPCEIGEWVQWLIQQIENPGIKIYGEIECDILSAYIVAMNSVMPPVFDSVAVLYLHSPHSHKITRALVEATKKWAIIVGAKRGLIPVPENHSGKYMESFGGKKIANIYEWKVKQCHH